MTTQETPVLIVGAGPAGLTAAATLARYGVDFLLVERRWQLSSLPRATGVSTRTMELMRSFGLEDEVRAGGVEAEWLQWFCESLACAEAGQAAPTGFPTREQSAVVSPTGPGCVPQDRLEPVLLEYLRSGGVGRVELGTEVVALDGRPGEMIVTLRDAGGGAARKVRARYLIAADGAHSTIRQALGIRMRGPDRLADAVTVLFRAPLWELVGERRYAIYMITNPDAEGVLLPAGGDRWLYGLPVAPGNELARLTGKPLVRRILAAIGAPLDEPRIERTGTFRFAAQVAERYRSGDAFLIGDAAHRATPRGGTGMNTGIHDGFDLGWKLAWVLNGWADGALLDSYERERKPVAEHNVAQSAERDAPARESGHALHADLGGRIAHAWIDGPGHRVSTIDLLGPGLTLFTGPEAAQPDSAASQGGPPLTVRRLDHITARAIGLRPGGTLVARPDGTPARGVVPDAAKPIAA